MGEERERGKMGDLWEKFKWVCSFVSIKQEYDLRREIYIIVLD